MLAAAGVVMASLSWRIARLKGPALELSDRGLLDRRLSPQVIPWAAIRWKVVFNGRSYSLQFDIAEPHRSGTAVYWDQRVMGWLNRLFRFPELTVVTLGTGKSAEVLGRELAKFSPPA